jgi:hypothetical protein
MRSPPASSISIFQFLHLITWRTGINTAAPSLLCEMQRSPRRSPGPWSLAVLAPTPSIISHHSLLFPKTSPNPRSPVLLLEGADFWSHGAKSHGLWWRELFGQEAAGPKSRPWVTVAPLGAPSQRPHGRTERSTRIRVGLATLHPQLTVPRVWKAQGSSWGWEDSRQSSQEEHEDPCSSEPAPWQGPPWSKAFWPDLREDLGTSVAAVAWGKVSVCSPGWPQTHNSLPQLPECWFYRFVHDAQLMTWYLCWQVYELSFFFFFLLFICTYNVWVIFPPSPAPLWTFLRGNGPRIFWHRFGFKRAKWEPSSFLAHKFLEFCGCTKENLRNHFSNWDIPNSEERGFEYM